MRGQARNGRIGPSTVYELMQRLYRKVARAARHIQPHIPFTLAGITVFGLALLALQSFGYRRMDLVVFALSVCAISIVIFCLLIVIVSGLILRRRLAPHLNQGLHLIRAEAGHPNETGLVLPPLKWLPLVTVQWQIVAPDPIPTRPVADPVSGELVEEITPQYRCLSREITRLFIVRDVLGLCRFAWRDTRPHSLQVLPRTGHLRQLPALRSLDAEDGIPNPGGRPEGDRMDIRRYTAGDSVRDIMWRVYARNRHLNVRLPEKSLFHSERTLAYLITSDHDEAAAGVARFALAHGALGSSWVLGVDGTADTAQTVSAALPLIAQSRAATHYGLDAFLQQQSSQTACVLFAPATAGPWTDALERTFRQHPGPFTLILATDGLADTQHKRWWQELLTYREQGAQGSQVSELRQLLARLSGPSVHLVMVDRETGLSFDQHLKRV